MTPSSKGKGSKDPRPAPPLSLQRCWDKAKWHRDAENFPRHLPASAAREHILAALRFLDEVGMLTASGREELSDRLGEDTALLLEHVRAPARAFLDQAYDAYLEASSYGEPPPVHVLRASWESYGSRYDLKKKPKANPYQEILIKWSYDRKIDSLLRRIREFPAVLEETAKALEYVPSEDRPLLEAALALLGCESPLELAPVDPHPHLLLEAMRYLDTRKGTGPALKAACVLADRLKGVKKNGPHLVSLAWAVNLDSTPEGLRRTAAGLKTLTAGERDLLARAVNLLYQGDEDPHLAICAMRSVGDASSLALLKAHVHSPAREGTTQVGNGPVQPGWFQVRNEAIAAIQARLEGRV